MADGSLSTDIRNNELLIVNTRQLQIANAIDVINVGKQHETFRRVSMKNVIDN